MLQSSANEPTLRRYYGFNEHPPLGVNATHPRDAPLPERTFQPCFNRHPPLGVNATLAQIHIWEIDHAFTFQWAPTLGGECYRRAALVYPKRVSTTGFNGHPPLGVNATIFGKRADITTLLRFQWAPTLGGECYSPTSACASPMQGVSVGTHPWG